MSRYPLNLPRALKQEAERRASGQGVSLNQFIVWAVAEKIGELSQELDDPRFPHVEYRSGAARQPIPYIRGTGIRAQTLFVAASHEGLTAEEIADEYGLTKTQVTDALSFCEAHREEIEAGLTAEEKLAPVDA